MVLASSWERARNALFDALPPSRLVRRGPSTARRVALTFDDGPQDLTGALLDTLDRLGVAATFFLMGDLGAEQPQRIREYVRRGHQIAGHGWDHRSFATLSRSELRDQLHRTEAVLGPQPTGRPWVRPPYGKLSPAAIASVLAEGFTIALWSFDSNDHSLHDPAELAARCAAGPIEPGEVLLFHEGQAWTIEALPAIVGKLHADGFECVTMADLFAA